MQRFSDRNLAAPLGIEQLVHDRLVGIVARVGFAGAAERSLRNQLLIEAGEEGWWYSARPERGCVVGTYMTDADLVARAPGGARSLWRDRLATTIHTRARLAAGRAVAEVWVRSATSRILARTAGESWLAVGDAAMSFDPLSSQGISKGLAGGLRAGDAIAAALAGAPARLEEYSRQLREVLALYLETRRAYYRAEGRWPEAPFWRRRRGGGEALRAAAG